MQMSLTDAIESIAGTSELADAIIARRFGDMESLSASQSTTTLTDDQYQDIIDDILANRFDTKNSDGARQLMLVVLRLLDELSSAQDRDQGEEKDHDTEVDERNMEKLAQFREAIQGARIGDLRCYYTDSLFKGMKQETRSLVAQALVEYSHSLDKEPYRLWVSLMQNNGIM